MPTLVIETATAACSVALLDGAEVLARRHDVVGRGHAERLVPMIRECLDGFGKPDAILIDCGPGSFTGVRVGLAAARAFGFAWSVPVYGFSSLSLLAAMAGDAPLVTAIGGGHGEFFVQRFANGAPTGPLASLRPEVAAATLTETLLVGSSAQAIADLRGYGDVRDILPDASEAHRIAPALAALPPTPLYGRAPDAKVPAARVPA